MHLPLSINSVFNIKHPPWSTFRIIGERNMNTKTDDDFEPKYDLLLLDSRNFVVQTINDNKSQKLFTRFGTLNVIKDDIINIFPSSDKNQSSIGTLTFSLPF